MGNGLREKVGSDGGGNDEASGLRRGRNRNPLRVAVVRAVDLMTSHRGLRRKRNQNPLRLAVVSAVLRSRESAAGDQSNTKYTFKHEVHR
ncbi:MAG: hypothetical protein ACRD5M_02855 [Candidatus Acidiferrales bacterium]